MIVKLLSRSVNFKLRLVQEELVFANGVNSVSDGVPDRLLELLLGWIEGDIKSLEAERNFKERAGLEFAFTAEFLA